MPCSVAEDVVCLWLSRLDAAPDPLSRAAALAAVAEILASQQHPEQLVVALVRMLAAAGNRDSGSSGSRGMRQAPLVPTLLEVLLEVQKLWPQVGVCPYVTLP